MCVCTHQAQQVEEQVCVLPDQVVCLTAQINKVVETARWFVSSVDDISHVRGEDEGGAVSKNSSVFQSAIDPLTCMHYSD